MKKYLFGVVACVLAAGMSAFTIPSKLVTADYYFIYDQNQGFDDLEVQDPSNWTLSSLPLVCPSSNVKACEIGVPESSVDLLATPLVLKSTITIPVNDDIVTDEFRVETGSDVSEVYNRGN